jgi:hypothetical protein
MKFVKDRCNDHCVLAYGEQLAQETNRKSGVRVSTVVLGGPRWS